MTKINRKNADERINEMSSGFERITECGRYEYYYVTEAEYSEILNAVLAKCTKELNAAIANYSYISVHSNGDRYAYIGTYTAHYAHYKIK